MSEPKKRGRPKKADTISNSSDTNQPQSNGEQIDINQQQRDRELRDIQQRDAELRMRNQQQKPQTPIDNDDDLKSFLKNKNKMSDSKESAFNSDSSIDEQTLREIEDFESQDGLNDIPTEEFNPLNEPVMERTYTGGMVNNGIPNFSNIPSQRIIEEPNYRSTGNANKLDVDKDLMTPNNDIPSDNGNENGGGRGKNNSGNSNSGNNNSNSNNNSSNNSSNSNSSDSTNSANSDKGENTKELSPKEKREAVEGTADAILLAYKNYIPLPFIYFAQYNGKTLEKLHDDDEINLETEVKRDGTTFREHTKIFNEKVETTFEVTDAEVDALREPLIDVLAEKEIAFTPSQRLMFVAGQFIVTKVMLCVKLIREKKNDIDEMKSIHKEKMDAMREQFRRDDEKDEKERENRKKRKAESVKQEKEKEKEKEREEEEDDDRVITDANIVSEVKTTSEKMETTTEMPSLDDALEVEQLDDDTNDIPE